MDQDERQKLLKLAIYLEGGLGALGLLLGYLLGTAPLRRMDPDAMDLLLGLAAALPLCLVFLATSHLPWPALQRIRDFLDQTLWPLMRNLSQVDIILLALLAGLGEEIFFRGWLEPWVASFSNPLIGLIVANLFFALAHAITPTYALIAGLLGALISVLILYTENLLTGIVLHAFYDWMALSYYLYTKRNQEASSAHE